VRASIRAELERKGVLSASTPAQETPLVDDLEQYYTPGEVASLFRVSPQTVKLWMQDETEGVIRYGNHRTTATLRRYVTERYSKSAVRRLEKRLLDESRAA
jgi:hypothetical protein